MKRALAMVAAVVPLALHGVDVRAASAQFVIFEQGSGMGMSPNGKFVIGWTPEKRQAFRWSADTGFLPLEHVVWDWGTPVCDAATPCLYEDAISASNDGDLVVGNVGKEGRITWLAADGSLQSRPWLFVNNWEWRPGEPPKVWAGGYLNRMSAGGSKVGWWVEYKVVGAPEPGFLFLGQHAFPDVWKETSTEAQNPRARHPPEGFRPRDAATGVSSDGRVVVGWTVWVDRESGYWVEGQRERGWIARRCFDDSPAAWGCVWAPDTILGRDEWAPDMLAAVANQPTDVSADGSTVVGVILEGASANEPFAWREQEGMNSLGVWQGTYAHPTKVSGNGKVVVGTTLGHDTKAWVWITGWASRSGGRALADVLARYYRVSGRGDWQPISARSVSDDGRVIMGAARDSTGKVATYVLTLSKSPDRLGPFDIVIHSVQSVVGVLFEVRWIESIGR